MGTLKARGYEGVDLPTTAHRPWGTFATLKEEGGYKVKRITVRRGESLSLQYHHHRAEHWVVVKGLGLVQVGDREMRTEPGPYRYIPSIRIEADVIAALLAQAELSAGLISPRVQEPGKPQLEPFRDVPTPMELLRRRLPGHRPPAQPAWVTGMFMLVRSEVFASVRGFDERFFMYCEDFDLCAPLRLAGWRLQVVEDLHAA